jgi:hypothetical protein
MMTTKYAGIDYGLGRTNIGANGIRFGVIPMNEVCQAWSDSSEPQYGEPTCPKCGNEARPAKGEYARFEHAKHECSDYVCHSCKYVFGSESAFGDEPQEFTYEAQGYALRQGQDDSDIWVMRSPYFTYAQFCSPCAPGACYLLNPLDEPSEANKCFCLGHDWFEGNKAPYPVMSVETGLPVQPE